MMTVDYINLKRMPAGRHAFAWAGVRARADKARLSEVSAAVDLAQKVADATLEMEMQWSHVLQARKSSARGDAVAVDRLVDGQIVAIHQALESDQVGDAGDPVVDAANKVTALIFPEGPGAITGLEFEEQLGRVDTMIKVLDNKLAAEVRTLGLGRKIARLKRLVEAFRQELRAGVNHALTYDDVKAQREQLHAGSCRAIAAILHLAPDDDTLADLLEPVSDQQRRVSDARSRHKQVTDVDPQTGEELPASEDAEANEADAPTAVVEPVAP